METISYKVIADFPCSMHKVGDIIEVYQGKCMAYVVSVGDSSEKFNISEFPHLYELVEK